jgi:hypothetical protein
MIICPVKSLPLKSTGRDVVTSCLNCRHMFGRKINRARMVDSDFFPPTFNIMKTITFLTGKNLSNSDHIWGIGPLPLNQCYGIY